MEELRELLGLGETASVSDIHMEVKSLVNNQEQNKEVISGLRTKVESLEDQVTSLAKGSRDQQVNQYVSLVQKETQRYVGKENIESLKNKASQYALASEDDKKQELWEDMKTICVAYGDNSKMKEELNSISDKRDGSQRDIPEHEQKVQKLVDTFDMKYATAFKIVTSGQFEEKMKEAN